MKLAILCDSHFGCRNDSRIFLDHQETFFETVFFPTLKKHKIDTVLHLGDIFDRRKYINFNTLSRSRKFFFEPLQKKKLTMHTVLGNHDTYYTNTNEVNSVSLLLQEYDNIHIYEREPVELSFDSLKILMCPWIAKDNHDLCVKAINTSKASILCGHFGIKGFEMQRGVVADHGMDHKQFKNYEAVYSGHFHHPSEQGNIKYLGAQYEMNWSDYGGKRGFHILDTETRELEFVENPVAIHHKMEYDDTTFDAEDLAETDFSWAKNCFVRVNVKERTNPYLYDLYLTKLNECEAADVKTVEETVDYSANTELLLEDTKDTKEILYEYVDSVQTDLDKKKLKSILGGLYQEAINL